MTQMRHNNHHHNTPEVAALDNRGLTVREVRYHRHPDTPETIETHITHHTFTDRGHLHTSADPRLSLLMVNNFEYLTTLSGSPLLTTGVDNGTLLSLNDIAGRPYREINATGIIRTWQYEDIDAAGRLQAVTEQEDSGEPRIAERFVYAGNTESEKRLNLAGALVRHYDTAGLQQTDSVSLTGTPLSVTRHLLKDVDTPETVADWQGDNEAAWKMRLDSIEYTTQSVPDATGTELATRDAMGNLQRTAYDVAGLLTGSWLTLKNGQEQIIVKSLTYSAAGQKLREEHGNGVVTTYTYEPQTQRLTGIRTERPQNHQQGQKILQDLRYEYDPVGNVLKVSNDAEATRYWRNQKVVPENTYIYDSLYQLVSATGREMASAGQQKNHLPHISSFDNAIYTNYTRNYRYDTGGNLAQIRHSAPATNNSYATNITVSNRSNRAVLSTLADGPAKVDALFTTSGHQTQLMPGQQLIWTPRGELQQALSVRRDEQIPDNEYYRYDSGSQRVMKISRQQANKSTQTQQTLYLAGLELRTTTSGVSTKETLHTITVGEAGRAQVRVLHWEKGKPDTINNNQPRYSYDNLIGSSGLEVDTTGQIISLEEYYPYGGTAILTARSQVEAGYKTIRYSGKERDATGLYYYGYRYYQSWAGRWLSADPAGTVDGLNLFRMCRNNPVTLKDSDGLTPEDEIEKKVVINKYTIEKRGLEHFGDREGMNMNNALVLLGEVFDNLEENREKIRDSKIFSDYFGVTDEDETKKVFDILRSIKVDFDTMHNKSFNNFILVGSDTATHGNAVGFVYESDPEKRVFITKNSLHQTSAVTVAMTVLHEISHFSNSTDFLTGEAESKLDETLYFPAHKIGQSLEGYIEVLATQAEHLLSIKRPAELINNAESLTAFVFHFTMADEKFRDNIEENLSSEPSSVASSRVTTPDSRRSSGASGRVSPGTTRRWLDF